MSEEHKSELRRRMALSNPVTLKLRMDEARGAVPEISRSKGYHWRNRLSGSAMFFNFGAHFFHLDFFWLTPLFSLRKIVAQCAPSSVLYYNLG
jgi:hypothetical protein